MDFTILANVSLIAIGCLSGIALISITLSNRRTSEIVQLLGDGASNNRAVQGVRRHLAEDTSGKEFEQLKEATRKKISNKNTIVWNDRFFRAGLFTEEERRNFRIFQGVSLILGSIIGTVGGSLINPLFAVVFGMFGLLFGLRFPISYIERKINHRNTEIMFYLPLVIEQLVIGVSSSLDIGPCIKWVVSMADERDSHNAVTELLRHAQHYMKSGASMEEALIEVARLSGHTELKHVFMSLSQVAKHGGEISRQLQELANAVSLQRESKIEARIKKLELEATGPVGLVFLAFMGILMVGLMAQAMDIFK